MKYAYRTHPPAYALGEIEKFYGNMEAKGWRLVKRGGGLSKFAAVEPNRARYRVEVVAPSILDQPVMSEEQLAVFADCGWEYVTDQGCLYIFRAPEGNDAPEFYMDPTQQAATLRALKKRQWWGISFALLLLAANLLLVGSGRGGFPRLAADMSRAWVEQTALLLAYGGLLLTGLLDAAYGSWHFNRLYRRMKRGIPLDHDPKGRRLWYRVPSWCLQGLVVLFAVLTVAQWAGGKTYDLPKTADGPYLLLEELGETGERTHLFYDDRTSEITVTRSLLATHWDVFEVVEDASGSDACMYQDIYRLPSGDMALDFAGTLMDTAIFARSAGSFTPVAVEGLDAAWLCGHLEVVAVKGTLVTYVTYLDPSAGGGDGHLRALLPVLTERWSAYFS